MRGLWGAVFGVGVIALLTLALLPAGAAAGQASWLKAPVVPKLAPKDQLKLKARVARGKRLGLRTSVFAKVGDSNTEFSPNLYGMACRKAKGLSPGLRKTLRKWNRVRLPNSRALPGCRPWTSFSRRSAAAQAGVYSSWSLSPISELLDSGYLRRPEGCPLRTTPLDCEIDVTRPRYALVMLGTNDIGMDNFFGMVPGGQIGKRLGAVIRALLARGVVPVLSTIPPVFSADPDTQKILEEGVARINAGTWRLSREFRLPMINLWRALQGPAMVNFGLTVDGMHLGVKGNGGAIVELLPTGSIFADSVDFRPGALRFGANRRNLIWLKTLARLDRITG